MAVLRACGLVVGLVAGCVAPEPLAFAPLPTFELETPTTAVCVIPFDRTARVNLGTVWWTTPRSESLAALAGRWGTTSDDLVMMNPRLSHKRVDAGARVTVYRHQHGTLSRSVGAPNKGVLEQGVPFPEGDAWILRAFRPRSYATQTVVAKLATALTDWHERYPQAHPIKIGELSKYGGGRVKPHASHRTGRDVDIGYVLLDPSTGHRFIRATPKNLDAAATWGLVRQLLSTGEVEAIFMDAHVQALLLPHAFADWDTWPSHLFSVLALDLRSGKRATIRAWRGHADHMHVRFRCTNADLNCRGAVSRKKRKRRRRRGPS
ncbi:MAG: penicillin-insensitive murein endopeptidase [Nannocystaceae bacterium]|nr:penicillin-insensitive murein endopeptidase [Nannocystaceae bacterium]